MEIQVNINAVFHLLAIHKSYSPFSSNNFNHVIFNHVKLIIL